MKDSNISSLKLLGHQPSPDLLALAERMEEHAALIRNGKIIGGAFVTIGADNSDITTTIHYDTRGVTLLGGIRMLDDKVLQKLCHGE